MWAPSAPHGPKRRHGCPRVGKHKQVPCPHVGKWGRPWAQPHTGGVPCGLVAALVHKAPQTAPQRGMHCGRVQLGLLGHVPSWGHLGPSPPTLAQTQAGPWGSMHGQGCARGHGRTSAAKPAQVGCTLAMVHVCACLWVGRHGTARGGGGPLVVVGPHVCPLGVGCFPWIAESGWAHNPWSSGGGGLLALHKMLCCQICHACLCTGLAATSGRPAQLPNWAARCPTTVLLQRQECFLKNILAHPSVATHLAAILETF